MNSVSEFLLPQWTSLEQYLLISHLLTGAYDSFIKGVHPGDRFYPFSDVFRMMRRVQRPHDEFLDLNVKLNGRRLKILELLFTT
jgi:hypothetical protein